MDTQVDMVTGFETGSEPEDTGSPRRRRLVIGVAALALGAGLYFGAEASPFEIVAPNFQPDTAQVATADQSDQPTYFGVFRRRGGSKKSTSSGVSRASGGLHGVPSPGWKRGDEGDGRLLTLADAPAAISDAEAGQFASALEAQIASVPTPETPMLDAASSSRGDFSASDSSFGGGHSRGFSAFPSGGTPSGGGGGSGGGASGAAADSSDPSSTDTSDLTNGLPAAVAPDLGAASVPEPGSWVLMIAGFAVIGAALRWRPARLPVANPRSA
jgi:hypothetical protein